MGVHAKNQKFRFKNGRDPRIGSPISSLLKIRSRELFRSGLPWQIEAVGRENRTHWLDKGCVSENGGAEWKRASERTTRETRAPNSQGHGRLITKSEVWEMFQWMWMTPETWYLTIGMLGEWISAFGPPKKARIRPKMGFRQWKKISSDPNWLYSGIGMKNGCSCKRLEI